ncbi:T-cell surface glycoprotein CD3 epsilon chain-like [Salminus brasiliensis]|uniref:T-cell surface glycoprotein CD3 epsilon chain-like n=1 Tax=Salminus brasiliensis TaxID=930266 RepID=UPI003B82E434
MMRRRGVTWLLVLLTLAVAIAEDNGKPALWIKGTTVTLQCSGSGKWTWKKDGKAINDSTSDLIINKYTDQDNGLYTCSDDKDYYIYTNLKVCEGCVELDVTLAMGIVFGDVLITLGVILMVYLCAKRKAAPASAPPQRAPRRQPNTAQPSDSTYQELNPETIAKDVYSDVKRK